TTSCPNDSSIGPFVGACRGGFDFTLLFEHVFLAVVPGALFVVFALPRAAWLFRRPRILNGHALQFCKLTLITSLVALQSALLGVQAVDEGSLDSWAAAAAAMQLVAALCLFPLSFLEHARIARPSMLITIFLLVQVLFDAVMVRTAWLVVGAGSPTTARFVTAALTIKVLILIAETRRKTRWLRWNFEEHSPEETSGIISLSVFLWLNRLFIQGYRSVLAVENLYPLDLAMDSKALQEKLDDEFAKYSPRTKFGLPRALARAFLLPLLLPAIPRLALIGLTFAQPFFIQALLRYLGNSHASENLGYGLMAASGLIFGGMALARALYAYFHDRFLCMVRGALSAAIYTKTSRSPLSNDSAAVTLVSTDTERVVKGLDGMHEFWANAAEIAVGSWLLHRQIGASFAAPFALMLASMILVGCIGRLIGRRQAVWMELVQRRVGATADAIAGMRSVKLGGMAGPVSKMIESMRAAELGAGNSFRWLFTITIMASIAPPALSPLFVLVFASGEMETTKMFTALSFVILLTTPLVQGIRSVPKVIGAFTCLGRIQVFLEESEHADFRRRGREVCEKHDEKVAGATAPSCPRIILQNGSFGWTKGNMVLKNLDITFPASKLTVVVGPTASGKSTLCKALLGETPFASGSVHVEGAPDTVGFCDFTPFLYNTTIKNNIIGRSAIDLARYEEVLDACMLRPDLLALAHGDKTTVGSNGSALSGGQRQRVTLARAVYVGSGMVILDDVVRGLDNDTASEVLRRLFGQDGLLRRRAATVVLCTHSALPLVFADHIVALGADGTVVEQGALSDLTEKRGYVASMVGNKTTSSNGSGAPVTRDSITEPETARNFSGMDVGSTVEDTSRMYGDRGVYRHYLSSISTTSLAASTASALFCALSGSFGTLWLKYWAEDALDRPKAFYAGIFGLAQGTQLLMSLAACIAVAILATISSGAALHTEALSAVVRAPSGLLADVGAVTTLFAQDMTLVDGELPLALLNVLIGIFEVLVRTAVVTIASPWMALGYPLIGGVLWMVQRFYLRTSRQLRLLDLETKGPMITHFLDTIRGLATIRAFGWTEGDVQRGHELLTNSQRPAYLLSMIQNWLELTLDLVVAVVAVLLVALATQTRSNAGFTGASLAMLMTLSQFVTRLMRFYTELETSIGAVARIRAFSQRAPPEMAGEDVVPSESWPAEGTIHIRGVCAAYGMRLGLTKRSSNDEGVLALRNLMLGIQGGKKVAICGRSGSGKSSLILLLMRLLEPLEECRGRIEIDGLALHCIDRTELRQRILAIPQDTVFLPAGTSVKENLDNSNVSTDVECEQVLQLVGLHQMTDIYAELKPEELSAGQKQLFSLARVILRRRTRGGSGGVLLLDELSAGVDRETERRMQEVVGQELGGYTVLAVSHRLGLVAGKYDEVIVMDEGRVVERGDPECLMMEEDSHFARLLRLE
ncbi:canalicular multispecific organic anion transporter 1, partial [Plectosphaerella plurivora]